MPIVIEPATANDAESILRIRLAAEDWLARRGIRQWPPGRFRLDAVRAQIDRDEWFLARNEAVPCGAFRLLWSNHTAWHDDVFAAYVHGLVIDRQYAGAGLGVHLLAWAEERARSAGAAALRLDCVASNTRLRQYYADHGFHEVGTRDITATWTAALFERRLDENC